ncbi:MFS general substrate transporter [Neolentinus lepideus HHB14362 ss-1]|uniref:MFS general substrate transporter n=1 Tax=Neolentinus lepideus HHB14362 ss-1 TaxID=1314782 RepID=A0A165PCH4_9AGAM|nr:MFS general substrate transporter [Neolentinus lepideus HHB14362 ss-1]
MAEETSPLLKKTANSPPYTTGGDPSTTDVEREGTQDAGGAKSTVNVVAIVLPLAVGVFLAAMDQTIVVSSYASIGNQFNQLQNTSWIATGYMLTVVSFQPLYGKLSDIFGRKGCLLMAYSIFAIGCLFCGLARNMNELIIARAFAGVGGGGISTLGSIIMSDVVPLRSRGTWQGVINIIFATGQATGAPLGGILADSIGWRWAFLIQVPITVVAILSAGLALKIPKREGGDFYQKFKRIDFVGAFTLVCSVFFLLVALDRGGNVSWDDKLTISCIAISALFWIGFGFTELKLAKEPFAPKRIVVGPNLIASYLVNFFGVMASMCLVYQVSLYFQAVRKMTASQAGVGLLPNILAGVAGSLAGGLIMQATGKYYVLTICMYISMFLGTLVITLFTGTIAHSLIGLLIGLVFMAFGNGAGITTTLIALIANAGPEDQAIATAVSYLYRSLGSVMGISIGSTLVQDKLRNLLRKRLAGEDLDVEEIARRVRESLTYVDELQPRIRAIVRQSYNDAVPAAFWFSLFMTGVALISTFFIKEKILAKPSRT